MLRQPYSLKAISAGRGALSRQRPDGFTLLLAAFGILGAALVLAREINYGVGLSADAVNYISVARSLLAGDGFTEYAGTPYHYWPPLYPLLLAAASLGIFDPLLAAGPLNAALFGLTVFVVGIYLRRRLASRLLTLWCCLAVALAAPLLNVAQFAWSEMPFILLATLALLSVARLLGRDGGNAALLWAGVFTALACLTRYVGVTLVLAIVPLLALQRGVALPAKARRIVIYTLLALTPLGLWILRNQLLFDSPTGPRDNYVSVTVAQQITSVLTTVVEWWLPAPPAGYFAVPADYAAITGAVWIALLAIASGAAARSYLKGNASSAASALLLLTGFAAVYAAAVIALTATGAHTENGISPRLAAPAYLPVLLGTALALDRVLSYLRRRIGPGAFAGRPGTAAAVTVAALAVALGAALLYQAPVNARAINRVNSGDANIHQYNSPVWRGSAALRYIRAEITDGAVFSQWQEVSYIYAGGPNHSTRHRPLPCSTSALRQQLSTADVGGGGGGAIYLLWIYGLNDHYESCRRSPEFYGGLAALLAAVPVEPAAAFADGVLLRYRPSAAGGRADGDADVDARRALRQHYAAIAAGVPVAVSNSGFALYLDDWDLGDAAAARWATYINEQCGPGDTQAVFYLQYVPEQSIYLTAEGRQRGFNGYAFNFDQDGIRMGGRCMVSARLPAYAMSVIRAGQHSAEVGAIWEVEYEPERTERLRAEYATVANQPPVVQDDFAVYHSGEQLIYAKAPCAADDTAAPFFLLITPTFADDLPKDSRAEGFENRGFSFYQAGALLDGRQCVASAALPDYGIASIHTGQVVPGGGVIWSLEYEPDRPGRLRAELDAAASQSPIIQADFAVYRSGGRLIYVKESCAPSDTEAAFYLHIVPVSDADLSASGRRHGFDNRDFDFDEVGALLDGRQCIASVALPDYDIAAIRTGQYRPDAGRLWEGEFAPAGW